MRVEKIPISFQDARGQIIDVLKRENVEYATIITSRKGAVRGNHFHKDTVQYLYVLSGALRVATQMPGAAKEEAVLQAGDMVVNTPNESHAFEALEDTTFLVLTRGPRGGEDYEKDTFRLDVPLIDPRS